LYIHPHSNLYAHNASINRYIFAETEPLKLISGKEIAPLSIGYETAGTLNKDKSNVVLICHGLTGDQFFIHKHPITGKNGWWEKVVGPGKPIDTDKYFVICQNVLGGCMGTTGPAAINPYTGKPWGLTFPVIEIKDMVNAQAKLLDALGIEKILCMIGGSMGGMQVMEWAITYPERVQSAIAIATSWRHSAQNIAFHEVARQAIYADPNWLQGDYYSHSVRPEKGLSVARMTAHVTYMSEQALHKKFGRNLQDRDKVSYEFEADFQIESYLRHQGSSFVDRFDANSYLYITKAMDYYDLSKGYSCLAEAFKSISTRFCIISFTSDWLFPTYESRYIVRALNATSAADVSFVEIETDKGHDAFLLDEPEMFHIVDGFLDSMAKKVNL
jgi:homoserine O-acetyltransferase